MRTSVELLLAIVLGSALADAAPAEPVPSNAELGVDLVTLKHGPRLRGAVIGRMPDGSLTLAVARDWLRSAYPGYYESRAAEEATERRAALVELRDRLANWIEHRPGEGELAYFLKKQAAAIDRLLKSDADGTDAAQPEFLLLDIPAMQVERVYVQSGARRQVAIVAWREGLADVEKRSARSLTRELQKRGIDPARERADLSDRLPPRRQSDAEWAARQAIVEYQLRRPLDFQGTGETLIRTGEGAKAPNAGELLASVLKGQLGAQLEDLFEPPRRGTDAADSGKGLKRAIEAAEREGACGFRVTLVSMGLDNDRAVVETRFLARVAPGRWETVWRHTESIDASRADKDRVERIAKDPQVKKVLELLQGFGLEAGEEQVRSALRFGAATMQAQEAADAKFLEFRDRYLQRLEGPPLKVGDSHLP